MTTLDRYITKLFLLNLVILFFVVIGLICLLDLILNFDEFVQVAQQAEGGFGAQLMQFIKTIIDWYIPNILLIYVFMVGLLPTGAAAFTLGSLVRHRELIAMLAGGVSLRRVAMPFLVMAFAANLLMVVDQEFILPRMATKLQRSQSHLKLGSSTNMKIQFVPDGNGALFTSPSFNDKSHEFGQLTILRREPGRDGHYGRANERITADAATWNPVSKGWDLTNGVMVRRNTQADGSYDGFAVHQKYAIDFFPTDLDPDTILARARSKYRQLLSMSQLSEMMSKHRIIDVGEIQRIQHSRFSMVILNMLIMVMTLPYFLMRSPETLMVPALKAAGLGIGAWAGGFMMGGLGSELLPPAAIAWLPVAMYLPLAYYQWDAMET